MITKPGKTKLSLFFCVVSLSFSFIALAAEKKAEENQQPAGEFFGIPVSRSNYNFAKGVIIIFGNHWGGQPTNSQELEDCAWQELLLSYEAFRRNITVDRKEIEEEIDKTLKAEKIEFDWRKDKDKYSEWIKGKANEPPDVFENQIQHLIQLQKLRKQIMDTIEPVINEDEAYQKFLNEYNTLGIELAQFNDLKEAGEFYRKAKADPKFWEERKKKSPDDFKRPGFTALEFLMEMWKFPKEAVYKMMEMDAGEIYPPAPIYKGYGVFLILEKRPADPTQYPKLKNSYFEQIKMNRKYIGFNEWLKNLKQQAGIKIYPK